MLWGGFRKDSRESNAAVGDLVIPQHVPDGPDPSHIPPIALDMVYAFTPFDKLTLFIKDVCDAAFGSGRYRLTPL